MQIGRKMTDLEAVEVLSVVLEHPVYITMYSCAGNGLIHTHISLINSNPLSSNKII